MNFLKQLVHEAHRRSLWQVLSIYLVGSWVVLQVVDAVTDSAGLPEWTPGFAFVLLLIGLPIVVATAIVQEGAPGMVFSSTRSPEPGEYDAPAAAQTEASSGTGSLDRPSTRPSKVARFLTWKKAIWGGVAAGALLIVSAGAYLFMWSQGIGPVGNLVAQGLIEEGATVVLADFESTDPVTGEVVTEALRVDLSASPLINVVPASQLNAALARMDRPSDVEITSDVAREIAVRDGYATYLIGSVQSVGGGVVLTAQILATETGEPLASFRSTAENESELLGAIDRLSQDIREKAGESLRSIRAGEPLEVVTTGSLRALELYGQAIELFDAGDEMGALPLLEEAVEIDPGFAMAHRKIAVILRNTGIDPQRGDSAAALAYQMRDRLTERERGLAEAYYFELVLDDPERSQLAYERVLDRYPDDLAALNNMGVTAYIWGDYETAREKMEQLRDGPFESHLTWQNLGLIYTALQRYEDADAALDSAEVRFELNQFQRRAQIHASQRGWSAAHVALDDWATESTGNPVSQVQSLTGMAITDLARGRWREAMLHLDDAEEVAVAAERWTLLLTQPVLTRARAHFGMLGDRETARSIVLEATGRVPGPWMATNFGSIFLVSELALFGGTEPAEEAMEWYRAQYPDTRGRGFQYGDNVYRAHAALAADDAEAAVRHFRTVFERLWPCEPACGGLIPYGLALEQVGRTDDAIATLEAQLDHWAPGLEGAVIPFEPLALDRLGHLYESKGDYAAAADAYQRLLDNWPDPDPELMPVVQNARARIQELTAEGR